MTETLLVTGAAGFLGRNVAAAAARAGWRVVALGNGRLGEDELAALGIARWLPGSIAPALLDAIDEPVAAVVHCAGSGSVAASIADPARDFDRTVVSSTLLLDWVRRANPAARVAIPSSGAVYGSAHPAPFGLDTPAAPMSPYGWHKLMVEQQARSFGAAFGVASAAVRFFSLYGPGLRKQLLWDACGRLAAGPAEFGGTGRETRDWLHIDDAAAMLLAALDHAEPGAPVFNGGTGVATTTGEVLGKLASELGNRGGASFSGQSRPGDPPHMYAAPGGGLPGFAPATPLAEGLAGYVAWWRTQP